MAERRSTVEQVLVNCWETVECLAPFCFDDAMTRYQSLVVRSGRLTVMYQSKVDLALDMSERRND